ncbi:MAG: cell division protein ZipA [Moraxellaceae bacterium]|jgi:cell division protein ZipA|nr:cell division protein ZipA [Moraxellaceae bacterium]
MELLYGAGLLIVAVLLWRAVQWFREYRRKLRIRLEPVPPGPGGDDVTSFPELGKVKVRPRITADGVSEQDEPAPRLAPAPRIVAADPPPRPARAEAPVPAASTMPEAEVEAPATEESVPVLLTPVAESVHEVQQDMFAHEPIPPRPFPRKEPQPPTPAQVLYDKPVEPVRPVRAEPEVKPHVDVQDVIAVHVVCRCDPFNGEDLLRCILSYGLRFGEMSIFHRHERPTGQGRILFSMAKAVEPGIFDLEAMTGEEVPGVSFFLSLPGVNSIHAFDIMVDTAKRLATELQGEILDEQQQPLTRQLVEHYRERVQEFERRRLMQRPAH